MLTKVEIYLDFGLLIFFFGIQYPPPRRHFEFFCSRNIQLTYSVARVPYPYIDPDYNSPLIYWWGYCNRSIPFTPECNHECCSQWTIITIWRLPMANVMKSAISSLPDLPTLTITGTWWPPKCKRGTCALHAGTSFVLQHVAHVCLIHYNKLSGGQLNYCVKLNFIQWKVYFKIPIYHKVSSLTVTLYMIK